MKIQTNAEVWFSIKDSEMKELEDLDRMLLRRALNCPVTTPKEACHLELGLLPINCILKSRRVTYLHYIARSNEEGMLKRLFRAKGYSELCMRIRPKVTVLRLLVRI